MTPDLQPEHIRALDKLVEHFDSTTPGTRNTISSKVWEEGAFLVINEVVAAKHIPCGRTWRWNQTKSRKTAKAIEQNVTVNFHKLIPRKKRNAMDAEIPTFKLWWYEIVIPGKETHYALWCERGIEYSRGVRECEMHVSQFSFLAEFMDPETAADIW
eukprot:CAMPEP_0206199104 /NCGR_PEP_ID=MMETSP0166-20121206/10057_1 /ASSEMBLY_ACC=CAM_ASM_000260 /TAXON_ID=95228 /ORGANISM="Vannella robusta, Strain DIVA3 518/3/11/1/6" /LENGTH=156 /DNA_ID=CAMNT_0053617131 /DNA_START=140 /DNA_END=607 /DNA_ORIENTATION=+